MSKIIPNTEERILLLMSDSDDHTCEGWNGIGDENFGKAYIDVKDILKHPVIKRLFAQQHNKTLEEVIETVNELVVEGYQANGLTHALRARLKTQTKK